jgi:N-acyl-D-amino-acid deacylase
LKNITITIFCILFCNITYTQIIDIIIKNATIIDGSGSNPYISDIAISANKILLIQKNINQPCITKIDATGLIVAPGFIDIHTHIEGDEAKNSLATNFIYDGVTTVLTGNCGSSHTNLPQYFSFLDSLQLSINVGTFIGHNDVRKQVMQLGNQLPTTTQLQQMKTIVDSAMKAGAFCLSTGLIYAPGCFSSTNEIVALAKVAAKYKGVYATHMRNEGDSIIQAINESVLIAKKAKISLQISHIKLSGQNNWGRGNEVINSIKNAQKNGLNISFDQYPYAASSTSLSTLLPDWALANNAINNLDSVSTNKIINYMLGKLAKRNLQHFAYVTVANYPFDTSYQGKNIEQINILKGNIANAYNEAKTIINLLQNGNASAIFFGISESDIKFFMQQNNNMVASDASIREWQKGNPHPRGYGTNARVLGVYVRQQKIVTLPNAIQRMTGMPALKFNIAKRGFIKEGFFADITIFDENTIIDNSTFANPHQLSSGVEYVIVNGAITLAKGKHTGLKNGKVLARGLDN